MSKLSNVGNLISLYLDEIDPGEGTDAGLRGEGVAASVGWFLRCDGRC